MIRSNDLPTASSSDQPKRVVAARFQNTMVPAGSAMTTASARSCTSCPSALPSTPKWSSSRRWAKHGASPPSPMGSLLEDVMSCRPRIERVGIDLVSTDGIGDHLGIEVATQGQAREHGNDDVSGIIFEVTAERGPGIGKAKPIGSEGQERGGHPARDLVGNKLDEVGNGHDRARSSFHHTFYVGDATWISGVETVPAFDGECFVAERLVARRAPDLGGDVVVVEQHLLGF